MLGMIAKTLPTATHVTEQLLEMLGPDVIWQIRRLGERTFQAWTRDGRVLMVTVKDDGDLSVKEAEAVY